MNPVRLKAIGVIFIGIVLVAVGMGLAVIDSQRLVDDTSSGTPTRAANVSNSNSRQNYPPPQPNTNAMSYSQSELTPMDSKPKPQPAETPQPKPVNPEQRFEVLARRAGYRNIGNEIYEDVKTGKKYILQLSHDGNGVVGSEIRPTATPSPREFVLNPSTGRVCKVVMRGKCMD